MAVKISSKDVLIYLNELGYNNINAQQLKEFIQDLKKLIKYEERKREKEDQTLTYEERSKLSQEHDIFSILHSQETCASKAKAVQKKESVISLQIKRNKCPHHCKHQHKKDIQQPEIENEGKVENEENKENQLDEKKSISKKCSIMSRPKSSFIRPSVPVNRKSDPVALYHQYQAGWKRHKVPGEDNRTELRWAIREKMSRGPSVARA